MRDPYLRERPLIDYIEFLQGQIISIFQKLNQSSSIFDFPFVFNDIISELEKRVIASQILTFHGNDGIFDILDSIIRPNYELSKGLMESFLLRFKEIAVETENNAIVKKRK